MASAPSKHLKIDKYLIKSIDKADMMCYTIITKAEEPAKRRK